MKIYESREVVSYCDTTILGVLFEYITSLNLRNLRIKYEQEVLKQ